MTSTAAYRAALALAVATALFLVWGIGALGVVGVEGDRTDMLFLGVLAIGLAGAVVSRLRPAGMAVTLFATAGATLLVGVVALLLGEHEVPESSVAEILGLTGMFAALFAGAGWLFRSAERSGDRWQAGKR